MNFRLLHVGFNLINKENLFYIILPYCQVTRIQTEIVKCHYRKTCNLTVFNWVDDDALVSFLSNYLDIAWVKCILLKYLNTFKQFLQLHLHLITMKVFAYFKYFHKEF